MSGVSKAISDTLFEQAQAAIIACKRNGDVSWKLQAIISAKEHGIKTVADIYGTSRVSLFSWIKKFEADGISGLSQQAGRGRKSILSTQQQEQVRAWIQEAPNMTIKELRLKIQSNLGKEVSKSTTHNLIKSLGFAYITPRPKHHKQDEQAQLEFKKKSTQYPGATL